jgi:hypothetical protein
MSSTITFLRRAFTAIINNKYAPWIAMAIYILIIFLSFKALTVFFSFDPSTHNIVNNWGPWDLGRVTLSILLRESLFITIIWFVISKIIAPDTLIPLRAFIALYFSALTIGALVNMLLSYSLIPLHLPFGVTKEITGWVIQDIIVWSLFLSGILLAKRLYRE